MKNFLFLLFCLGLLHACVVQKKSDGTIYATKQGAIKGYDPVAYFMLNRPVKVNKTLLLAGKERLGIL